MLQHIRPGLECGQKVLFLPNGSLSAPFFSVKPLPLDGLAARLLAARHEAGRGLAALLSRLDRLKAYRGKVREIRAACIGFRNLYCQNVDCLLHYLRIDTWPAHQKSLGLTLLEYLHDICRDAAGPVIELVGQGLRQLRPLRCQLVLP